VTRRAAWLALALVPGCVSGGGFDLAPAYHPTQLVVPESWHGASPFAVAQPADDATRTAWWTAFGDPTLDALEVQATDANPDLEATAERFVQARARMMEVRSQLMPQLGAAGGISDNRQSDQRLFRPSTIDHEATLSLGALASWEPDLWDEIRNASRMEIFHAQSMAAEYANARLSMQAELADDYFTLRGLDAEIAIYTQTIEYYGQSLAVVTTQYQGQLASSLDVARAQYQVSSAQATRIDLVARREVTEHAIAALVNRSASSFQVAPVDQLNVPTIAVPSVVPSSLLERRPDIAAREREMAEANRSIGIAIAAFFPHISLGGLLGLEGDPTSFFQLGNGFWSYGSVVSIPIFDGGLRRAQLQHTWSSYRETEDHYRSTVLDAFRDVEDGLTNTRWLALELEQRRQATEAAQAAQSLSTELFRGGLASSLELIYSQVNTLDSRVAVVELTANLLRSVVALIRSLGGGWAASDLPAEDAIQPFDPFQFWDLDRPRAAGGIDVDIEHRHVDLVAAPPGP
jgi:NodT family efflux transporter outer membrane factor (OMF) lipoprotein